MEKYYTLRNKNLSYFLTETNDVYSFHDFDTHCLALCNTDAGNQRLWRVLQRQDGSVKLISCTGKGIHRTADIASDDGSTHVIALSAAAFAPEQFWLLKQENDGVRIISQECEDLCLTASKGGGVLAARYEKENTNQLWTLEENIAPVLNEIPEPKPIYPLPPATPTAPTDDYLLHELEGGSISLCGFVNEKIAYVHKEQLLKTDWRNHVDQFRNRTDTYGAWRGEFWGKMMRAACLHQKYFKDESLYADLEYTVRDMLSVQEECGRFSTYPQKDEFTGWDMWCRKYVLLGLESFYEICRDNVLKTKILRALCLHADYILQKIGPKEDGKIPITLSAGDWQGMPATSILEPMIILYRLTGYKRYLDFSTYIVEDGGAAAANIFELAYEDNLYPYQYMQGWAKAYEMSSCFEGLAEYAYTTGSKKWKRAVVNYCQRVAEGEITITGSGGGDGPMYNIRGMAGEQWNKMAEEQTNPDILHMQETCVTVTWIKLCDKVLRMTEDPLLADQIESCLYNALLGAIKGDEASNASGPAADFLWDYFSLLTGSRNNNGGGWIGDLNSCCPANGPSATGLIPFIEVMTDCNGPVVSLYIPGKFHTVSPLGNTVTLTLDTDYPISGHIKLCVTPEKNEKFTVKLRIPEWSKTTSASVNGTPVQNICSGSYLAIERCWTAGDTVELDLEMSVCAIQSPQGTRSNAGDFVALKRGPIVMARDRRFNDGDVLAPVSVKETDGTVAAALKDNDMFNSLLRLVIKTTDGSCFSVSDYASAGSTWSEDSFYTVWLPIKHTP